MTKRQNYINPTELHNELRNYKTNKTMSDHLGKILMTMCDHISNHSNFKNYSQSLKDDMKSHALLLICRYIDNIDPDIRDPRSCFNYVTTSIFNGFKQVLNDYYKQKNIQRELIHKIQSEFSSTYKIITNDKFEEYE